MLPKGAPKHTPDDTKFGADQVHAVRHRLGDAQMKQLRILLAY